jgi:hypothetical protein
MNKNGKPRGLPPPKTAFKPGQSGNPKGRPKKGQSFKEIIAELSGLEDITGPDGKKISRKQAVTEKLYARAIRDGDVSAIRLIIEKLDGKEPQPISGGTDDDGEPIPVVVAVVQKRSIKEWQKEYNRSGSHSPVKQKPSRVRRSNCSSEEPKAEGNPTS